jgi:Flp pilus assembly protein TadD
MRKLFILTLCGVAVLFAAYVGYRGYVVWKNKHLMNMSREFLAKSDMRNAVLSVQEVLRSDRNNLDATRMMAQLTDAARLPSALLWRNRVVGLAPNSSEDRLALAQTALTMQDYASATNALEGLNASEKQTATYHNLAGMVAAALNKTAEAETHFLEASRLEPLNPSPQMNLAIVRLRGTNVLDVEEARITLQRLAANPTNGALRCQALRELTIDALRQKNDDQALVISSQLLRETNSSLTDRIMRLNVLQKTHRQEFGPSLAACQREAATDSRKVYELATWELEKSLSDNALKWLRTLPPTTQTNQPETFLIAQCYTSLNDWRGLQSWLEKQRWGELEFLRHALLTRALRGQDMADTAKTEWQQALTATTGQRRSLTTLLGLSASPDNGVVNDQKQSLVMLLRLAAQWNWPNETEDLLRTIASHYPEEQWATRSLVQLWYNGGQTRSLMQLFNQELKKSPADLTAKNNLAMTALLLNAKEFKPNELAHEIYEQAPTNSSFASTYAFSLYLQGKKNEALQVMRKLDARDLQNPTIAGYYGLILKATGNNEKAKVYLDWSDKAPLLPEERKLFGQAKIGT